MISNLLKIYTIGITSILTIAQVKGQALTINNLAVTTTSSLTMTVAGDFKNQNGGTINNAGTIKVSGNWTNNASNGVFSTSAGTVTLNGTAAQTIGGTNSTSFYNLTLNNSSGSSPQYTLGSNQTVINTLTLSAGNTNLAGDTITIGSSASITGLLTYTAGWMYGGAVKRWLGTSTIADGATAGLFPLGTSTDTRPYYISAPSVAPTTGGTISVSHTDISGTTASSFIDSNETIDRIFNANWIVSTGNGLAGGTYNMRAGGTGFTGITDYTVLRLLLAGGSVGTYATNGGTNANPQINRTGLTMTQLTNHFYIGYPAGAGPLPVTLLEFDAKPDQSAVKIHWVTASEINSDYFTVERSADGENYDIISNMPAAGNSSIVKNYSLTDNSPLLGRSFYRLKETDFDGYYNYYPAVEVRFDNMKDAFEIVSVNTLNGQVLVNILSSVNEIFDLELYDSTGRLVSNTHENLTKGYHVVMIPARIHITGMYMVVLGAGGRIKSKKII